jgi:hypothetical protein
MKKVEATYEEQELLTLTTIGANGFESFGCSTGIGG